MDRLPGVLKLFGAPTKAFYDAYRHSQEAIRNGVEGDNPLVGFRISLIVGATGLIGAYGWQDARMVFWLLLAFTGFSCAWQLWPFGKREPDHSAIPAPGWVNRLLSHHILISLVLEAVGNGAMAYCIGKSGLIATTKGTVLAVVLSLLWVPFCRFVFVNLAVLELLKYMVDRRMRIVVFRRFQDAQNHVDPGFDERHRTRILPALGAFGQLYVVHNESLVATPPGANADSEEIVSQLGKAIKFEHADWVFGVSNLIRESDIAVCWCALKVDQAFSLKIDQGRRPFVGLTGCG